MTNESATTAAADLCKECGLCCNGALFDRVFLQQDDHPKALAALGLRIKKKSFFTQPCAALCGTRCTIYADRPERCRLFECRTFRDVAAGTLSTVAAVGQIEEAKRQVAIVEALLDSLGADNRRKPIAQRCATAFAEDPAQGSGTKRAGLAAAAEALQDFLSTHFRLT